jgi:hypothetical protein
MNNIDKRIAMFVLLCIPARVLLMHLVKNKKNMRNVLIPVLFAISLGFIFIYSSGIRSVGSETFGAKIWWNSLRPLHSLLYFISALLLLYNNNNAHIPLLIDILVGFSAFLYTHYISK